MPADRVSVGADGPDAEQRQALVDEIVDDLDWAGVSVRVTHVEPTGMSHVEQTTARAMAAAVLGACFDRFPPSAAVPGRPEGQPEGGERGLRDPQVRAVMDVLMARDLAKKIGRSSHRPERLPCDANAGYAYANLILDALSRLAAAPDREEGDDA